MKTVSTNSLIIPSSMLFAAIVGTGVYGFGHDYYVAYFQSNLLLGGVTDRLGYLIATLTIGQVHIGVFLTSLLLSTSVGLLTFKLSEMYGIRQSIVLLITFLIFLHTWPVIMSTSNAMRQGIMMSFLYFGFVGLLSRKIWLLIAGLCLAYFSHRSGVYFVGLAVLLMISEKILSSRIFGLSKHAAMGVTSVVLTSSLVVLAPYLGIGGDESRIISGDFRLPFFVLNCLAIVAYFLLGSERADYLAKYLLYFSCSAPVFLLYGHNWEYERLNMVMLIPFILLFSRVFNPHVRSAYLFITSVALLALTFYTGMYASFS